MAKKLVICPDCGHQFPANFRGVHGQTAGVRFHRTTAGQFQTSIDVPGEIVEHQKYYTMGDRLLGALVVGVGGGSLVGYFASIPWHVSDLRIAAEIILGSALTGWSVCSIMLVKVRAWEMGKALPMAIGQYLTLAKAKMPDDGVTLTVDHRTEAGRTINRFGALPVDVDRFNEWAQGVLVGKSLAEPHWVPKAKMFTQPEYRQLLAKMKAGQIIVNLGSNKGNTLTGGGRRALSRHLADFGITPPSPASEDFLGERLAEASANNGGNTPLPRPGVRAGGQNAP